MSKSSKKKYVEKVLEIKKEARIQRRKEYLNSQIKEYHVTKETILMDFLIETLSKEPRNTIKTILSKNCVAVNGSQTSQFNYKLYPRDVVMVSKIPFPKERYSKENKKSNDEKTELIKLDIIYEDDDFLVINKPSGLLSIESDKEKTDTAYKQVLEYMKKKDKFARCFQVHRIDKMTSGVLLFTKSYELKQELVKDWNKIVSLREYIALVDGEIEKDEGTITSYLLKNDTNLMYSTHDKKGEKAITNYKVMKKNKQYTLLDVKIDTGKKNQIRVAMNDLGHPIVGDDKYGKPTNPINRLGLHAYRLELRVKSKDKFYSFTAPTPSSFNKVF